MLAQSVEQYLIPATLPPARTDQQLGATFLYRGYLEPSSAVSGLLADNVPQFPPFPRASSYGIAHWGDVVRGGHTLVEHLLFSFLNSPRDDDGEG
jgi:hypothetical protein